MDTRQNRSWHLLERFPARAVWLAGAAGFAFYWIVARAVIQSITIDEADAYNFFVWRPNPSHWEASSVNHLLNSLLMRLFVGQFGLSAVTVRLPSLIGAAIYIVASYCLVRLIADEWFLRWPLLVCFVYNPFVMDYLVAGRGYSLGVACLLAAVALAAGATVPRDGKEIPAHRSPYRTGCYCSLLAALSFCATFSFAVVDAVTMFFIFLAFARERGVRLGRLALCCILPGLLLTAFLAGSILVDFRQISLAWGAKTLGETAQSVITASYYEPNPYLLNPPLYRFIVEWQWLLLPLLAATCVAHLFAIWHGGRSLITPKSRWISAVGVSAAAILFVALGIHRLMYRIGRILMPLGRRAVFIVPLCMLAIGAALALRVASRRGRWIRGAALGMLWATAAYFICCLRSTYFMEWKYNADAKELYSAIAHYNHTCGVQDIGVNWRYVSVLNFYRVLSGYETFPEITGESKPVLAEYTLGKPLYVIHFASDMPFIDREKLKVVYHSDVSDAAVAVRPEIESDNCRP